MSQSDIGALVLIFFVFFICDVCLIIFSYIYSRFIFNRYLKRNHLTKWRELVHPDSYLGLNLFSFDKTEELRKFRCDSKEDFGDPNITRGTQWGHNGVTTGSGLNI
jgi:hypothetical protein